MSYPFRVTSPIVFVILLFFCSTLLFLPFTSIIPGFPPPRPSGLCLALGREGPELTKVVWHSTHYHDDPAAYNYHVEERMLLLKKYSC